MPSHSAPAPSRLVNRAAMSPTDDAPLRVLSLAYLAANGRRNLLAFLIVALALAILGAATAIGLPGLSWWGVIPVAAMTALWGTILLAQHLLLRRRIHAGTFCDNIAECRSFVDFLAERAPRR